MATKNWLTQNVPGLLEYLDGDPNAPGYRADHAGGNHHSHVAFVDKATTQRAMAALQRKGIKVTGFGDRGGHASNSYHYSDQAFDVPGAQWGKATDAEVFAGSRLVRETLLDEFNPQWRSAKGASNGGTAVAGGSPSAKPTPGVIAPADNTADLIAQSTKAFQQQQAAFAQQLASQQQQQLTSLNSSPLTAFNPVALNKPNGSVNPQVSPADVGTPAAAKGQGRSAHGGLRQGRLPYREQQYSQELEAVVNPMLERMLS
jgi:hypothetical protein